MRANYRTNALTVNNTYGEVAPGPLRLFLGPVGSILLSSTLLLAGLIMLYRSDWHSVLVGLVDKLMLPEAESEGKSRAANKPDRESFAERARKLIRKNEELAGAEPVQEAAAGNVVPAVKSPPAAESNVALTIILGYSI